jgi:hypothetical protein
MKKMKKKHMFRYQARLYLKPSDSPFDELQAKVSDFIDELDKLNCGIIIVPWSLSSWDKKVQILKKSTDTPTSNGELRKFFDGISARRKGGFTYFKIYLAHDKPFKTIAELLKGWFNESRAGIYETNVQSERPILIGWFWMSTNEHSTKDLMTCLWEQYGIRCHIFWRVITTGEQGDLNDDEKVRALHVEVASETEDIDTDCIMHLYRAEAVEFPLGQRMRFFPAFYTLASPAMQAQHAKMVKLQQLWLTKQVKVIQNRQIVAFDAPDKNFGNCTLRDVLMSIKGPDGRKPLFHAIARGKQPGQGWIIMTNDNNFHRPTLFLQVSSRISNTNLSSQTLL